MEVGLRVPLEADVEREGTVVLPARLLLDVARSLPGKDATSSCDRPSRTSRSCRAPRRSTSARCAPRTSRRCPSPAPRTIVEVPAKAFVDTIDRVARSASRDETRPVLTGILVSAPATSCGWSRPTPIA